MPSDGGNVASDQIFSNKNKRIKYYQILSNIIKYYQNQSDGRVVCLKASVSVEYLILSYSFRHGRCEVPSCCISTNITCSNLSSLKNPLNSFFQLFTIFNEANMLQKFS
eukprot:GFUD01065951.1.p1 GENE.GFUD01065951.1~~GFUD01065951.1.p1  ORF type:complete len:109 (+),score=4.94 GFUD01065951.1:57-383(+)